MRSFLVAFVVAGMLAVPAWSASVDPKGLVLGERDVPRGYLFDKDNSVLVDRAFMRTVHNEQARRLLRSGFVSGYLARYLNSGPPYWRYVDSGAIVFRSRQGTKSAFPWLLRVGFVQGSGPSRRVALGDAAFLHSTSSAKEGTLVLWRYGRIVAWVSCREMTAHRALALAQARKQQRRIAAALG